MSVFLAVIAAIFCVFGVFVRSKRDRSKSSEEGVIKTDEDKEMAKSFSEFALSFLRMASDNKNNFLFSPLALELNLAVIMEGSKGGTQYEIQRVLAKDSSHRSIQLFFSGLQRLLSASWAHSLFKFFFPSTANSSVETTVANVIYADKRFPLEKSFSNRIQKLFKASARNIDFEKGEESAKVINEYVCKKTNGMVEEIVSAESFDSLTHSLLVSTIHFQEVFMYKAFNFSFRQLCFSISESLTTVVLPYRSSSHHNFSFAALMPSGNFEEWKKSLTAEKMREAIEGTEEDKAFLWMPKFEVECTMNVKEALEKMGVKQVFNPESADLSGISKMNLHLGRIIQKATIEVHEMGTRASAVCTADITCYGPASNIKLDHPFLFLVLRDDIPLFIGQFV